MSESVMEFHANVLDKAKLALQDSVKYEDRTGEAYLAKVKSETIKDLTSKHTKLCNQMDALKKATGYLVGKDEPAS